jgi:hypothetical protein
MSEMKLKLSQKKKKKKREISFLFKQYPVRHKNCRKFLAAYLDRYLSLLDYVSLARSLARSLFCCRDLLLRCCQRATSRSSSPLSPLLSPIVIFSLLQFPGFF